MGKIFNGILDGMEKMFFSERERQLLDNVSKRSDDARITKDGYIYVEFNGGNKQSINQNAA